MGLLNEAEVNIGAPPLNSFDFGGEEEEAGEDEEAAADDDDVTKIDEGVFKAKLIITERKKEVKLAQLEARREDAKRKADLEERMLKIKEAKAWKELMAEEKEHMMMCTKDMDEAQLTWWKEYKADIVERKRLLLVLVVRPLLPEVSLQCMVVVMAVWTTPPVHEVLVGGGGTKGQFFGYGAE